MLRLWKELCKEFLIETVAYEHYEMIMTRCITIITMGCTANDMQRTSMKKLLSEDTMKCNWIKHTQGFKSLDYGRCVVFIRYQYHHPLRQ